MSWKFAVNIDDAGVRDALGGIDARTRNLYPVMDDIGNALMLSVAMRFESETDPSGQAWKVLAPSTIRKKNGSVMRGTEHILQSSRRLHNSITKKVSDNSVIVGTNLPYAAIHQFGGDVSRYTQTVINSRLSLRRINRTERRKDGSVIARKGMMLFAGDGDKRVVAMARRTVGEATIHIPARPYLGINEDDKAHAIMKLRRYLLTR